MKDILSGLTSLGRRGTVLGAAVALLAGGMTVPAAHAQTVTPGTTTDATLIWGVSGYAQEGVFAPWRFMGATGDAEILEGSVSNGSQSEYVPAAFPATSFPAAAAVAGKTPNAAKFTGGEGRRDENGVVTIEWDGDFTINAYGGSFGAPDETFSDPILTLQPSGATTVSFDVTIDAGQGASGNDSPAVDAGRITLLDIPASGFSRERGTIKLNPNFAGVEYHTGQNRTCTSPDVWGAWPTSFIDALPESVRAHYYSTGCGGKQNLKGALPAHLTYTLIEDEDPVEEPAAVPAIEVSDTTLSAEGEHQVTVTGTGFNNPNVVGSYGPFAGKGTGAYVVFGRFLDEWRPSADAPSGSRVNSNQLWALPTETFTMQGGQLPYIEIDEDGNFTGTLTVSKEAIDAKASAGHYGIYTYAGGGFKEASYELFVPITFTGGDAGEPGDGEVPDPTEPGNGVSGSLGSLTALFG